MRYKNKTISLQTVMVTNKGAISPLCNTCQTKDCDHHIERKKVSIFGVNKDWRLIDKGLHSLVVVSCDGYST